jgi:hypothetical protein
LAIEDGFMAVNTFDDPYEDSASVEFARERIGTEFKHWTSNIEETNSRRDGRQKTIRRETKPSEEHPFAKGEITEWRPGEGVVVRSNSWAHGRIKPLGD